MAIPSAGYDSATISNPSSALTDFTLIVDLSDMSSDWWDDVNTSTGARGRASKSDGTTELACDWIDFDNTAETGLLRVKYTGTLASSGTQTIRIYAPNTRNTAYGVSDTYGQYNAYDSTWDAYYPLGGGDDRTSNGRDGTAQGGVVVGGVSGKIGNATSFDGVGDYINLGTTWLSSYEEFYISALVNTDSDTSPQGTIIASWNDSSDQFILLVDGTDYTTVTRNDDYNVNEDTTVFSEGEWIKAALEYDNGANQTNYIDGVAGDSTAITSALRTRTSDIYIGNDLSDTILFEGQLQEVQVHSDIRSSAWRTEEFDQTDDNATFWGTWTWTSTGTTYNEAVSESIGLSETQAALLELDLSISESIGVAETQTVSIEINSAISESIGVSETQAVTLEINSAISESMTLSESTTALIDMVASIADSITVSDSFSSGNAIIDVSISEGIAVSDSQLANQLFNLEISEGIALSETQAGNYIFSIELSDGISVSDVISSVAEYNAVISESVGLTDNFSSGETAVGRLCMTISGKTAIITVTGNKPEIEISANKPEIDITGEGCI